MKKTKEVLIVKGTGEKEAFDVEKLRNSLHRAGAETKVIEKIIRETVAKVKDGMTTRDIYRQAYQLLEKFSLPLASKYKLRDGIMELGPSGFPFEVFMSELMREQGYFVMLNQNMQGKYVTHEVDIVAEKDDHIYFIECKYHNDKNAVTDVRVPMYIRSRIEDLVEFHKTEKEHKGKQYGGWIITNTRFTQDAIKYGMGVGLTLMGWDFPHGKSLREWVDSTALYPVTCLTTLTSKEKQLLLKEQVISCKSLLQNTTALSAAGIKQKKIDVILAEAKKLCE